MIHAQTTTVLLLLAEERRLGPQYGDSEPARVSPPRRRWWQRPGRDVISRAGAAPRRSAEPAALRVTDLRNP